MTFNRCTIFVLVLSCFTGLCCIAEAAIDTAALDEQLKNAAGYEYGKSRESLTAIADGVRLYYGSAGDLEVIEQSFIKFLKSDATLAGKQLICKQLSLIGSKASVPTLGKMLRKADTADMALYVLERIPAEEVDLALRDALDKSKGKIKAGIINCLGVRRDSGAVEKLAALTADSNAMVAESAIAALGKIGGAQARQALSKARDTAKGKLRMRVLDAYMQCADKLLSEGNKAEASKVYKELYESRERNEIRGAALRGMVLASGKGADEVVMAVVKGDDAAMQPIAIAMVSEVPGGKIVKAAAGQLEKLSPASQVQMLHALAERGDKNAMSVVVKATGNDDRDVRIAALAALGSIGSKSSVDKLASVASKTRGAEQEAARDSLYHISGTGVDKRILKGIKSAEPKVKIELIRSVGRRNMTEAVKTLFERTGDPDRRVRIETFKALKVVATEKHLPKIIALLMKVDNESVRKEAEKTVAAVARKTKKKQGQATAVLAVLETTGDTAIRCSLIRVLGRIGDSGTLAMLTKSLKSDAPEIRMAAVRGLSQWPGAEPMNDLYDVASQSGDKIEKVLALRGFIRLIGLENSRSADETFKLYDKAMDIATELSEKRLVLSGLKKVPTVEAVKLAKNYLSEPALMEDAANAVVRIAWATFEKAPAETAPALAEVMQKTKNAMLRDHAEEMLKEIQRNNERK